MGKQPAFQFYTGDWIQDTRCLSLAAKGAWIDLLCAMWRSQTRGKLSLPMIGYARLIGASADQAKVVIDELIDMQICDSEQSCNGDVTLINRRMVREENTRELTRYRVTKYRNANQTRESNANVTHPSSSSSSIKKKIIKEKSPTVTQSRSSPFIKPTIMEVASYCSERKNHVDPETWMSHYQSNGWKVGKNPMKDWKAAVRTWENNNGGNGNGAYRKPSRHDPPIQQGRDPEIEEIWQRYQRKAPEVSANDPPSVQPGTNHVRPADGHGTQ